MRNLTLSQFSNLNSTSTIQNYNSRSEIMSLYSCESMLKKFINILETRIQKLSTLQRWVVAFSAFNTAVLVTHKVFSYLSRKNHKYPPSLLGIPYWGSFFTFAYYGEKAFIQSLLPSYGPITMHKIGRTNILTINETNLIKTIIGSEYCALRPWQLSAIYDSVNKSIYSNNLTLNEIQMQQIVTSQAFSNQHVPQRRRLALNAISKIANRKFIEGHVNILLEKQMFPLLDEMATNNKGIWSPHREMDLISFNITFGALFGSKNILDSNNRDFITIAEYSTTFGVLFGFSILSNLFYIPNIVRKHFIDNKLNLAFVKNLAHTSVIFEKYINNAIKEHEKKNKDEFTIFDEIYENMKKDKNLNNVITDEILLSDLLSLVGAATDTTTATLESCLLFAAKYSALQDEIYYELKQFGDCGDGNNDIEYKNIANCVKFQAFIHEVLRVSAIVPKNTPHAVSEPCILKFNYMIDKNGERMPNRVNSKSIIFDKLSNYDSYNNSKGDRDTEYIIDKSFYIDSNLEYIQTQDNSIWGKNASKFNINHWIKDGKKGKIFYKNPNSLPFSIGKRDCPGRALAMKAIKLIMAKLFIKYKFAFQDNSIDIDITYKYGFVKQIYPKQNLVVAKRQ